MPKNRKTSPKKHHKGYSKQYVVHFQPNFAKKWSGKVGISTAIPNQVKYILLFSS
jgi:hypothetical protein